MCSEKVARFHHAETRGLTCCLATDCNNLQFTLKTAATRTERHVDHLQIEFVLFSSTCRVYTSVEQCGFSLWQAVWAGPWAPKPFPLHYKLWLHTRLPLQPGVPGTCDQGELCCGCIYTIRNLCWASICDSRWCLWSMLQSATWTTSTPWRTFCSTWAESIRQWESSRSLLPYEPHSAACQTYFYIQKEKKNTVLSLCACLFWASLDCGWVPSLHAAV